MINAHVCRCQERVAPDSYAGSAVLRTVSRGAVRKSLAKKDVLCFGFKAARWGSGWGGCLVSVDGFAP